MVHVDPKEPRRGDLWAFGVASIAAAAGVHQETVRRAIRLGRLDTSSLMAIAEWVQFQKVHGRKARTGRAGVGRAGVAQAAMCHVRTIDNAVKRGEIDLSDAASIKMWVKARRAGRHKPEPSPALSKFSLVLTAVPGRRGGKGIKQTRAWTVARVKALVQELRAIGFATAEKRGDNHVYLKPDILTLADSQRLLECMRAEGWTSSDLTLAARRRLGLFGGVTRRVEKKPVRRKRPAPRMVTAAARC